MQKTYLVSGGAGFIGSHLCDALLERGGKVITIDNLSSGNIENLNKALTDKNFQFIRSDIREFDFASISEEIDCFYHLASTVGVSLVLNNPKETLENNIDGVRAALKAAEKFGCRFIFASSSEVYGKIDKKVLKEDDCSLLGNIYSNRWTYSASKIVDEFFISSYIRSGLKALICRFFNVIGIRQRGSFGMVVPRFVHSALNNKTIKIYGDGLQKRCFCDVRDLLRALICLENSTAFDNPFGNNHVYNIGSDKELSVLELAMKIKEMTNSSSEITRLSVNELPEGFEDIRSRKPDISLIKSQIGWEPEFSIDESLAEIICYEKQKINGSQLK